MAFPILQILKLKSISIITMQDDFTGIVIDTVKWTEVDPDGIISQNDQLIFTYPSSLTQNRTNYLQSNVSSGTLAALQCTISAATEIKGGWLAFWDGSSDNEIIILSQNVIRNIVRLIIRKAGSAVYDENIAVSINNTFKILRDGDDISFYYLSAPDTWTILNPTANPETVAGMPSTMNAGLFTMSKVGTSANVNLDDFFLTNADYSTSIPT